VAVLIVAIVLSFKDLHYLDPALSLLITAYILWGVIRRLRETLFVFLQGVPKDVDLEEIKRKLLSVAHVQSLHHAHVWSLDGEHHVFSTHVKLEKIDSFGQMTAAKMDIKAVLSEYPFEHYTVETELDEETCALAD
jgi:cobalt-zinc-cadmium efflux system protein